MAAAPGAGRGRSTALGSSPQGRAPTAARCRAGPPHRPRSPRPRRPPSGRAARRRRPGLPRSPSGAAAALCGGPCAELARGDFTKLCRVLGRAAPPVPCQEFGPYQRSCLGKEAVLLLSFKANKAQAGEGFGSRWFVKGDVARSQLQPGCPTGLQQRIGGCRRVSL